MTLDLILLALLGLAAFNGWRSGAIAMLLSVAVLLAAGIGATMMSHRVGELFGIGPEWLRPIIGFVFTLIVLLIAGSWIKRIFTPKHGIIRKFDGVAGALLGFLRGALVLSLLLGLLKLMDLPGAHSTDHSRVYPVLLRTAGQFIGILRPYLHLDDVTSAISRSI